MDGQYSGKSRYSSRRKGPRHRNSSDSSRNNNSWRRNKNRLETIQHTRERRKEEEKENKQFELIVNKYFQEQENGLTPYEELWLKIETKHNSEVELSGVNSGIESSGVDSSDDEYRLSW